MSTPILVVDDSAMARKMLIKALPSSWNVEITQAENGLETVEAYRSGKAEVMFLDLQMPAMMECKSALVQEIEFISIVIFDVTDTALYQKQLSEALDELEETSINDGLTRIYNRRHFQALFNLEFSRASRHKFPLSIIMFDLDIA